MSYDLMVFDPAVAPRDRAEFMEWYQDVMTLTENRDPTVPDGVTGNLAAFYQTIRQKFPPMNGPDRFDYDTNLSKLNFLQRLFGKKPVPLLNESLVTDYFCTAHAIYLCFAWSVADKAYNRTVNIALSQGVGFFDVSSNNGVILHDAAQFDALMGL